MPDAAAPHPLDAALAAIAHQPRRGRGRPPKLQTTLQTTTSHVPPNPPVEKRGPSVVPAQVAQPQPIRGPPMHLLKIKEVAAMLGVTETCVHRNVKRGRLPKPVYVAERTPRWILSEIEAALLATRQPKEGAPIADAAD